MADRVVCALARTGAIGHDVAVRIPHTSLSPSTLRSLIEEFVTREGTDYGDGDATLDDKVDAVTAQLVARTAVILYDEDSESCTIARVG